MKITILCSSADHPVNPWLEKWIAKNSADHSIDVIRRAADLNGGDFLFLISCGEIVRAEQRNKYTHALVVHASDLPHGRGWSPHIWAILQGAEDLVVTLLEAADPVDSGDIWAQIRVPIPIHALYDEINAALFDAHLVLLDFALTQLETVSPRAQPGDREATWGRRRTPADSELDAHASIAAQFDLMRVCDPARYPAFFRLRGHRYKLTLEKMDDQ